MGEKEAEEGESGLSPREIVALAEAEGLCCRCIGRLFARVGSGLDNVERGKRLLAWLHSSGDNGQEAETTVEDVLSHPADGGGGGDVEGNPGEDCTLCGGLFLRLDDYASMVVEALEPWEYDSFTVGCRLEPEIVEREDGLWERWAVTRGERMKVEFNREVGKRVAVLSGKEGTTDSADVLAVVDTVYDVVEVEVRSLYVYGRYRKLVRDIPQTRWPCRRCRGRGCEECGGTGKRYPTSVEEIICGPLLEAAGGSGHAFHGMGREDIDARMLGTGRPFVAEIKNPRRRHLDLSLLEREINESAGGRVEVSGLRFSDRKEVREIKSAAPDKTYLAVVECERPLTREDIRKIETLAGPEGGEIRQRTPTRVRHRRGDMVRRKIIYSVSVGKVKGSRMELTIRASSGTYIKEFVNGDGGRTTPSISEMLGAECRVAALDVLSIHDTGDAGEHGVRQ
ncbi:MAG: tRNA pseudouridine(54/55) synthase Pus10 [Thermoplasmata archaeon]|nr:tRNA pseudouridine(54/55) synthase Pus10 [Thermoplasmata archaeon]